jgi:integrase
MGAANELARVEVHAGVAEVVEPRSVEDGAGMVRWSDTERALAKRALLKFLEGELGNATGPWRIADGTSLKTLSDQWLEAMHGSLDPGTIDLYRMHFDAHLIPHFGTPHGITKATIADFGRLRLRVVKRKTLLKERSTLRGFLSWCSEQGYLTEFPEFPILPRRATGTAFAKRRRGKATELSPEECRAVIATLPRWSRPRGDQGSYPLRARFIVAYETALRPATLDALSVPEHYSRGADKLIIADEIDKARFGRVLPLTEEARRALDSVVRDAGVIFGEHCYRNRLRKAARKVLSAEKARTFTAYDLRHARLTELAARGDLPSVAYLAGHKQVTTTSIYVRPGLRGAEKLLETDGSRSAAGVGADARGIAERTSSELRAMKPPEDPEQARVEWQTLINLRAADLDKVEKVAASRLARKRRRRAPEDDEGLDELVLETIASGIWSKHRLRAEIATSWTRLRASLARLERAGLISSTAITHPKGSVRSR